LIEGAAIDRLGITNAKTTRVRASLRARLHFQRVGGQGWRNTRLVTNVTGGDKGPSSFTKDALSPRRRTGEPVRIGMYVDMRNAPPWRRPWPSHYGRWLEPIEEGERLGVDAAWLKEHHLFDDATSQSVGPSPLLSQLARPRFASVPRASCSRRMLRSSWANRSRLLSSSAGVVEPGSELDTASPRMVDGLPSSVSGPRHQRMLALPRDGSG
jgi:hypothetical protein